MRSRSERDHPGWSPVIARERLYEAGDRLGSISRALKALGMADDAAAVAAMRERLGAIHSALKPAAMEHGSRLGHRRRREREARVAACREAADRMERAVCAVLG